MTRVSVVVPIHNAEANLFDLYFGIKEAMRAEAADYEMILVNDGSKDGGARILDELSRSDKTVKAVHFDRHYGQAAAIRAGIKQSSGELIALMDAGLQTDPKELFRLMPFIPKVDFINGKWTSRKGNWLNRLSWRTGNRIRNWITGEHFCDTACPMKLFKREVAESFYYFNGMPRFLPTLARMNGFSVIEVSVTHTEAKRAGAKPDGRKPFYAGVVDALVVGWLKKRVVQYRIRN